MYRAVLDTCALVPGLQRDFLLQLAAEDTYMPLWGTGILFELDYVLSRLDARRGVSDSGQRRVRLFKAMNHAFPGARMDTPKTGDYPRYGVHDLYDAHVAHAALLGKADAIVTDDARADFKASPTLRAAQIEVLYPHEFAANTVIAHPEESVQAIQALASRFPAESPQQIVEQLAARYTMTEVADTLSPRL